MLRYIRNYATVFVKCVILNFLEKMLKPLCKHNGQAWRLVKF